MSQANPIPTDRRAYDAGRGRTLLFEEIQQGSVNESVLLLASAARTATTATDRQENLRQRGVIATISVTAIGTASLTLSIQRWEPASSTWITMLSSAAITTNSVTSLTLFPGAAVTANVSANATLPRSWRVNVAHGNANPATYSVGISTLS
jgi:hypothetical protein